MFAPPEKTVSSLSITQYAPREVEAHEARPLPRRKPTRIHPSASIRRQPCARLSFLRRSPWTQQGATSPHPRKAGPRAVTES